MILEIEITEKMQGKLQERADRYAVEPSDIARMILAAEFASAEKPCWFDKLHSIVNRLTDAVMAVSKMQAPSGEK